MTRPLADEFRARTANAAYWLAVLRREAQRGIPPDCVSFLIVLDELDRLTGALERIHVLAINSAVSEAEAVRRIEGIAREALAAGRPTDRSETPRPPIRSLSFADGDDDTPDGTLVPHEGEDEAW